jgi:hypothetical protein
MKKKISALLLAFSFSTNAFSAISCTGNIQVLALNPISGLVQLNIGYGWWYICSVSSAVNGVPVDTCKSLYSMMLADQASGRQMSLAFDTTNYPSLSCGTIGNWAVPTPFPYYIQTAN